MSLPRSVATRHTIVTPNGTKCLPGNCIMIVAPDVQSGAMQVEELLVILVVEDEPLIRDVVEDALDDGGFEVVLVTSGVDALSLIDKAGQKYSALVTDVNLGPGAITGWEVARHARSVVADLAVVYMTGDSAADWASQGVPNSILLTKPFAPSQLLTAVSQLLNVGGAKLT